MLFPKARILLFAKAPEPGLVKTRLTPALSEAEAAKLYAWMLHHSLVKISAADIAPIECCCAPDCEHPFFQKLAVEFCLPLSPQEGGDLGERMAYAASRYLQEGIPVLLIGGDAPALQPSHLIQALRWLTDSAEAVIAPAEDGGYVMLGLRQFDSSLFTRIDWGSDSVLGTTRHRLSELGWKWRETELLWDLDRPADIQRLKEL